MGRRLLDGFEPFPQVKGTPFGNKGVGDNPAEFPMTKLLSPDTLFGQLFIIMQTQERRDCRVISVECVCSGEDIPLQRCNQRDGV